MLKLISRAIAPSAFVIRTKSKRFGYKPGKITAVFLLTPERQKDYEDAVARAADDRAQYLDAEKTQYEEKLTNLHAAHTERVDTIEHEYNKALHDLYVKFIAGSATNGGGLPSQPPVTLKNKVAA